MISGWTLAEAWKQGQERMPICYPESCTKKYIVLSINFFFRDQAFGSRELPVGGIIEVEEPSSLCSKSEINKQQINLVL